MALTGRNFQKPEHFRAREPKQPRAQNGKIFLSQLHKRNGSNMPKEHNRGDFRGRSEHAHGIHFLLTI